MHKWGEMLASDLNALQLLQTALRVADVRQQVYANNIANAETPGFKRQDVTFESVLAQALGTPTVGPGQQTMPVAGGSAVNWQAALAVTPQIVQDTQTSVDQNGNNVDLDAEMSNMAENQIKYNALVQDISARMSRLRTAIDGA